METQCTPEYINLGRSTPFLPLELTHRIIDSLHNDIATLRICSHTHRTWTQATYVHLFRSIVISSLEAWGRLRDILITSPSIGTCIIRVAIDGQRGYLPWAIRNEADLQLELTLAYHLRNIRSLELIAIALRDSKDAVSKYIRTNFLQVKEVRLSSISAPTPTVLQECVLTPRTKLVSVSLSNTTVSDPIGGRAMELLRYHSLEIDRFAFSMPMDLHHNWMFHHEEDDQYPKSNVEHLRIHDIHFQNVDFVAHALRVLGGTLKSLDLDIWNILTYRYPDESHQLLARTTNLRNLIWRDHGSSPIKIAAEICNVISLGASVEHLETIHLRFMRKTLGLEEITREHLQEAWNPVGERLQSDHLPKLKSLNIELSLSWCLLLLSQDGDYSLFFEGVFPRLHSSGRLHVQVIN